MTRTLCHRGVQDSSFGVWEENTRISFYNLFLHYCFKRSILCMFYYVHDIRVHTYKTYICFAKNWVYMYKGSEKAMAPHSSTLAWKIPWTEEPGGLQSMGSLRVRHDWETSLSLFTFMHWRRKWQPTPGFLPGESQGQGSLVGCRLWVAQGRTRLKQLSSSSSR